MTQTETLTDIQLKQIRQYILKLTKLSEAIQVIENDFEEGTDICEALNNAGCNVDDALDSLQNLIYINQRMLIEMSTTEKSKPVLSLIGQDGYAFIILGLARRVALKNKMDWETIKEEATSGDYDHLVQTMMKYFEVI